MIWIDQFANKYTKHEWGAIQSLVHATAPECLLIGNNSHNMTDSDALSYEWPLDDAGYASKTHGLPGHIGALPPEGNTDPAEVCDTIQTKARWFWHPGLGESDIQTAGQIRETIRLCHARNANYLLNVPPDRAGLISGIHLQRMKEIGRSLS